MFVDTLPQRHCVETVQGERFCCTMLMRLSGYLNEVVKKGQVSPTPPRPVAGKVCHKQPAPHLGSSSKRKVRSTSMGGAKKRALPLKSPRALSAGPKLNAAPVPNAKVPEQDPKG